MVARYVKATIGSSSAVVRVDVEQPNPDYGPDLLDWISQPGGQTLTLPSRNYVCGTVLNKPHSEFLRLKAATKGGVVVTTPVNLRSVSRVAFLGFKFTKEFETGISDGTMPCDRIVNWHCEHSQPPETAAGSAENGIQWHRGTTRGYALGCDIHDVLHDGIKGYGADCLAQGCRIWAIDDPAQVKHNDAWQSEIGMGNRLWDSVIGLNPTGNPSGNGHIQLQSNIGPCTLDVRRVWHTASGNYGSTVDGKNSGNQCHLVRDQVNSWDHNFSDISVSNGGTHTSTNITTSAPTGTPWDVLWRQNNPYPSFEDWLAGSGL